MMKGAGFTGREEDFISQIEDAAYRQQAQRQGNQVSPELLKRMDSLENQNKSLIDAQNRQNFIANMPMPSVPPLIQTLPHNTPPNIANTIGVLSQQHTKMSERFTRKI